MGVQVPKPIRLETEANERDYEARDLAKDQEDARRRLAFWLLAILTGVVLIILGGDCAGLISIEEAKDLGLVILSPIVVLAGTAVGFYFGGNSRG